MQFAITNLCGGKASRPCDCSPRFWVEWGGCCLACPTVWRARRNGCTMGMLASGGARLKVGAPTAASLAALAPWLLDVCSSKSWWERPTFPNEVGPSKIETSVFDLLFSNEFQGKHIQHTKISVVKNIKAIYSFLIIKREFHQKRYAIKPCLKCLT